MNAVAAWLAALAPLAILFVAFRLVERRRRIRMDAIERQIAMTEAIHRELGAVVAPSVTRTWLGGWRVLVPVPFERLAVISRVLEIARDIVAPVAALGGRTWEIVLVPQMRAGRRSEPWVGSHSGIEERHGSAGALPSVGGLGGQVGAHARNEERYGSAGALPSVGGLGGHVGAPHVTS